MAPSLNTERRGDFRRRALMGGTIRFRTRESVLSCVVRNISTTGAKLTMDGAVWMPENFELEISHQDVRVNARAVWRNESEIGVAFLMRDGQPFRSARREDAMTRLERERERLTTRVRQLSEEM
jgi:hypothetical protein